MFPCEWSGPFFVGLSCAMQRRKLYVFFAFIIGAAYAKQFRTFVDLAEKLKMEVTDHGQPGAFFLSLLLVYCNRVLDHETPGRSYPGRPESRPGDYLSPDAKFPALYTFSQHIAVLYTQVGQGRLPHIQWQGVPDQGKLGRAAGSIRST
jgi:hypothetical protein